MPTVSPDVLEQMERAAAEDPERRLPVVITMKAGAPFEALEHAGLTIERRFQNISAVSANAPLSVLKRLATLAEVDLIEMDGEMRAILKP